MFYSVGVVEINYVVYVKWVGNIWWVYGEVCWEKYKWMCGGLFCVGVFWECKRDVLRMNEEMYVVLLLLDKEYFLNYLKEFKNIDKLRSNFIILK